MEPKSADLLTVIMLNYLSRARSAYIVVDQQQLYSS